MTLLGAILAHAPVRAARRQEGTVNRELEAALKVLAAASVAIGAALLLLHA